MTNRQRIRERLQRGGIGATDEVLDLLAPLLDEVARDVRVEVNRVLVLECCDEPTKQGRAAILRCLDKLKAMQ